MRTSSSLFVLLVTLMLSICSCGAEKNGTSEPLITPDPPPDNSIEMRDKAFNVALAQVVSYGGKIDTRSKVDLIKKGLQFGLGFDAILNICFDAQLGDIPAEDCEIFVQAIIDGPLASRFNEEMESGNLLIGISHFVTYSHKSISQKSPVLAQKLIDRVMGSVNSIDDPLVRAHSKIRLGSIMYKGGLDIGKSVTLEGKQEYFDFCMENYDGLNELDVINQTADISPIDFKEGWDLIERLIEDAFMQTEGKAAMAGGLMFNDYEVGREYYTEALNEIKNFEFPTRAGNHMAFEFGFSQLNPADQISLLPKYIEVLDVYKRFNLMPPLHTVALVQREPEISHEYFDALHDLLLTIDSPGHRLNLLRNSMDSYCSKHPNSSYTPIFIGWALEWIEKLNDPTEKYFQLGRFLTINNGIIPDNIEIAKPRIQKIVRSIENKIPSLSLSDSFLEAILMKNPQNLKKLIGDGKVLLNSPEMLLGFNKTLNYRHYMFPDDDGGLGEEYERICRAWKIPDEFKEFDVNLEIALNLAGWDNDKAWKAFELMDNKNGQYPMKVISLVRSTRHYAPDFAQRVIDDLFEKYRSKHFEFTNPSLESNLVSELVPINQDWVIEFADIIVDFRGNKSPDYAWYSMRRDILKIAELNFILGSWTDEIVSEMYQKLDEDFSKLNESGDNIPKPN